MNPPSTEFHDAFAELRDILSRHADTLECVTDEPGNYYLNTRHIMKNKKPLFFGAVQIRKNYVSYHLMPVYVHPELLEEVSPELLSHMQGKSCFNFKAIDSDLFEQLAVLTTLGLERYRTAGYLS